MKKESLSRTILDNYLGCFGNFNREDLICKTYCALRLRCAVESDHNARMELLDDLIFSEGMNIKLQ